MAKGSGGGGHGALANRGGPVSMSIEGFDGVNEVLKNVAPREATNLLRNTVHAVAGQVRDDMRQRVRDGIEDTGVLRKAIVAKRERMRYGVVASNVTITHGKGTKNDAYYWHIIEWGGLHTDAQPFITPSVEAMRPQIPGIFTREFGVKYEQLMQRKLKAAAKKK